MVIPMACLDQTQRVTSAFMARACLLKHRRSCTCMYLTSNTEESCTCIDIVNLYLSVLFV